MRRQLLVVESDESIPGIRQFMTDVPEALRLLVQTTGVIVADKDDMVTGPTTDEGLGIGLERGFVEITTTTLIALAKQQSEDGSLAIGRPFPEFGTSAETPRTDDFLFGHVHGLEVLTHSKRGKEIERPSPVDDQLPSQLTRIAAVTAVRTSRMDRSLFVETKRLVSGRVRTH